MVKKKYQYYFFLKKPLIHNHIYLIIYVRDNTERKESMKKNKFKQIKIQHYGGSRIPQENRQEGLFYFEFRSHDCDLGYNIERSVVVNNVGSLIADRDILNDAAELGISDGTWLDEENLYDVYENVLYVDFDETSNKLLSTVNLQDGAFIVIDSDKPDEIYLSIRGCSKLYAKSKYDCVQALQDFLRTVCNVCWCTSCKSALYPTTAYEIEGETLLYCPECQKLESDFAIIKDYYKSKDVYLINFYDETGNRNYLSETFGSINKLMWFDEAKDAQEYFSGWIINHPSIKTNSMELCKVIKYDLKK